MVLKASLTQERPWFFSVLAVAFHGLGYLFCLSESNNLLQIFNIVAGIFVFCVVVTFMTDFPGARYSVWIRGPYYFLGRLFGYMVLLFSGIVEKELMGMGVDILYAQLCYAVVVFALLQITRFYSDRWVFFVFTSMPVSNAWCKVQSGDLDVGMGCGITLGMVILIIVHHWFGTDVPPQGRNQPIAAAGEEKQTQDVQAHAN